MNAEIGQSGSGSGAIYDGRPDHVHPRAGNPGTPKIAATRRSSP